MHHRPRLNAALALVALLAGCGGEPDVEAAPAAADPGCAAVLGRLPDSVLDARRGTTDVAGVAVWSGEAGRLVLRCGVPPPGPTTALCLAVDGVDWVFTEDGSTLRFTTYGRSPAVELTVPEDYGRERAPGALTDLAAAVSPLPAEKGCS